MACAEGLGGKLDNIAFDLISIKSALLCPMFTEAQMLQTSTPLGLEFKTWKMIVATKPSGTLSAKTS